MITAQTEVLELQKDSSAAIKNLVNTGKVNAVEMKWILDILGTDTDNGNTFSQKGVHVFLEWEWRGLLDV